MKKLKDIILVGGGGHALSVADAIRSMQEYKIIGYTDVEDRGIDIPYLGTDLILSDMYEKGVAHAAVGVGYMGNNDIRDQLYTMLKRIGFDLPILIDNGANVSGYAFIGEGSLIGKNTVINTGASVGKMCIINTGAIVEHGSQIGDFSHISVGTVLCGDVNVGEHVLVGANATVLQGLKIEKNSIIGAGSTILADVPTCSRVIGVWDGDQD